MASDVQRQLNEERSYSAKLAQKVQEQAKDLKKQADDLEWAAEHQAEYEKRLRQVDPCFVCKKTRKHRQSSPVREVLRPASNPSHVVSALARQRNAHAEAQLQITKLEKQLKDSQRKSAEGSKQNRELRKLLEKHRKDYSTARLRADKLTQQIASEISARQTAEDHARRLEITFERSGKGVALLKAARYEAELEKARKKIKALTESIERKEDALKSKETDRSSLQRTLDCLAATGGLPDGDAVEELTALRSRVSDLEIEVAKRTQKAEKLLSKLKSSEDRITDLEAVQDELATFQTREKELVQKCEELEATIDRAESDKSALLDFVQELQDENDSTAVQSRGMVCSKETSGTSATPEALVEGQDVDSVKSKLLELQNELGQYKAKAATSEKREALVKAELQSLQASEGNAQKQLLEAASEMARLRTEAAQLKDELYCTNCQHESLQKSWEEKQSLLSRVEQEFVDSDNRLRDAEKEVERLRDVEDAVIDLRTRETTLIELVEEFRTQADRLKETVQEKDLRLKEFLDLQDRLAREIDPETGDAPSEVLSRSLPEDAQDFGSWVERVKSVLQEGRDARLNLGDVQSQKDDLVSRLEEISFQYESLQNRHEDALKMREALAQQVDQMIGEMEELRAMRSQQDALTKQIESFEELNSDLRTQLNDVQEERDTLAKDGNESKTQLKKSEAALRTTREDRDVMAGKVDALRARVRELESKYKEASTQKTESAKKLEHMRDMECRMKKLQKQVMAIKFERDELCHKLSECASHVNELEHRNENSDNSRRDLVAELDRVKAEVEELKGECGELGTQLECVETVRLQVDRLLSRVELPPGEEGAHYPGEDLLIVRVRCLVNGFMQLKDQSKRSEESKRSSQLTRRPCPRGRPRSAGQMQGSHLQYKAPSNKSAAKDVGSFPNRNKATRPSHARSGRRAPYDEEHILRLEQVIQSKEEKIKNLRERVDRVANLNVDTQDAASDKSIKDDRESEKLAGGDSDTAIESFDNRYPAAPSSFEGLELLQRSDDDREFINTSQDIESIPALRFGELEEPSEGEFSGSEASGVPRPIRDTKKGLIQQQLRELHSDFRSLRSLRQEADEN